MSSGEAELGGVVKAAGIRRLPPADRWAGDDLPQIKGVPWAVKEEGPGAAPGPVCPRALAAPVALRRRYATRADLRRYGVTVGCPACAGIAVHGKTPHTHTEETEKWIYIYI